MGGRRHGHQRPKKPGSSPARGGSLEGFGKGSRVWYRAEPDHWLPGALASQPHAECRITLDSNLQHPQAGKVHKPTKMFVVLRARFIMFSI